MPERGSKTSTVPIVWANFGIFSAWPKWFPVGRDWWPWTKPGYISPRFFGIKKASSSLVIFHRAKLSTRSITHLCWCNWRTFWRKNTAGISPNGSFYCSTMPRPTGHLQPRRNLPAWVSNVLIAHPTLRVWPRRTTTCYLDWKKKTIERSPFFFRRGGHWCHGDLFGRTNFWNFLSGLQNLEKRAKTRIEFRGDYVE